MLVSIIMPYFKSEIYISKVINCVKNQSYKNWELIIIDDENSKKSKKILKSYKNNKKIKIYHNKKRLGAGRSRNIGIEKSKGELIAFLDSDDLWKKKKLFTQINEMKKRNLDLCFTAYECINEKSKILYQVSAEKNLDYKKLISACNIACSSTLIKKKIFKKIKFNHFKTKEDYSLWLKISRLEYKIGGINKILTTYLSRSSSLSSNHFNKINNAFLIYKKENNFGVIYSIYSVFRLYFNAFRKKFLRNF